MTNLSYPIGNPDKETNMSTLHLSVLNDGSVYPELCRIARKHHSGEWTYMAAFSYFRGVVIRVAKHATDGYDPDEITAATRDVMDYHVRHVCETPPAYKWKVTRGDATHVENWTLNPVTT
jgi:hypothetical protein